MFKVICNIDEAKKNSTNVLSVTSIEDRKMGYGLVSVSIGNECIVVDGKELIAAIENCTNNSAAGRRHYYSRRWGDEESEE